ncbi:MAG: hypothetical protein GY726_11515 [Proteobacteria bacterium]|nr:hypothetical protein [Pseudomonadota bacterium]
MSLIASVIIFVLYFANVSLGAYTGNAVLGDVGEMITLLVATIFFVVAIVKKETERDSKSGKGNHSTNSS